MPLRESLSGRCPAPHRRGVRRGIRGGPRCGRCPRAETGRMPNGRLRRWPKSTWPRWSASVYRRTWPETFIGSADAKPVSQRNCSPPAWVRTPDVCCACTRSPASSHAGCGRRRGHSARHALGPLARRRRPRPGTGRSGAGQLAAERRTRHAGAGALGHSPSASRPLPPPAAPRHGDVMDRADRTSRGHLSDVGLELGDVPENGTRPADFV